MNIKILDIIFKKYWNNQTLTIFEASALEYYMENVDEQERQYINKVITATI